MMAAMRGTRACISSCYHPPSTISLNLARMNVILTASQNVLGSAMKT